MQESLPLFLSQVVKARRQQTKLHRVEEIRLAGAVPPDEGVMTRGEGLDAVLLAEASEAADLDRFYRERRHASLFEFARLRRTGGLLVSCYECSAALAGSLAWSRGLRARQAVPAGWARGRLGLRAALFSRCGRRQTTDATTQQF